MTLGEYQVVGRRRQAGKGGINKCYRMRLFAPNEVVAKSRFWFYMSKLRKLKKAHGEMLALNKISERKPLRIKNFGVWLRYDSQNDTHNMYKEYRDVTRCGAIEQMYNDIASQHRAGFRSIQVMNVKEVQPKNVRRAAIKQFLNPKIRFPTPHKVPIARNRSNRRLFFATRPSTCF